MRCRDRTTVAFVLIDLDRFKHVNDLPRPRRSATRCCAASRSTVQRPAARHRPAGAPAAARSSPSLLARQRPPPARGACSRDSSCRRDCRGDGPASPTPARTRPC
ncbi:MAG: hypothetical protein MZW92_62540 [Comamonadaceae bacterium]|nr:hypothetical protein [Comamonadaceae bacterium]